MRAKTLRGRIALWSVVVVTGALTLFGASAAWNLRRELVKDLDQEIKDEATAFDAEIDEEPVDWNQRQAQIPFSGEDLPRFPYVEVRGAAGRTLYRSPALRDMEVFPHTRSEQPYELIIHDRRIRFALFHRGGLTFALGKDLQNIEAAIAGLLRAYFITLPLVLIAVGAGGWWIAHRAVVPIQNIAEQAGRISASDLTQRLPPAPAQDEIGHLTQVLNEMFDRLQRSFEQVTRFTSDASHELKTPLALMRAEMENALESHSFATEHRQLLADLSEQCSRLSQIVDGLLLLSRADDCRLVLEREPVDLVRLVRELIEDAEILADPAGLTLECQLSGEIIALGDRQLLARAAMNLIDNAIKHNEAGGRVTITAAAEETQAVLKIGNTGPGIPHGTADQVFDRFYRCDLAHGNETPGHGLGLSIAREITRAHGGDILLVRSTSQWTEFYLVLPRVGTIDLAPAGTSEIDPEIALVSGRFDT